MKAWQSVTRGAMIRPGSRAIRRVNTSHGLREKGNMPQDEFGQGRDEDRPEATGPQPPERAAEPEEAIVPEGAAPEHDQVLGRKSAGLE